MEYGIAMSRGFKITLGIIVVVVFAVILVPPVVHLKDGGNSRSRTEVELHTIANASQQYFQEYGRWPTSLTNMIGTGNPRKLVFLESDPTLGMDGWKHPMLYRPYDPKLGYGSVLSLGRDGKPGGTGDDADLEVRFSP